MSVTDRHQHPIDCDLATTNRILLTVVDELVKQRTIMEDLACHVRSTASANTMLSNESKVPSEVSILGELKDILTTQTDYLKR